MKGGHHQLFQLGHGVVAGKVTEHRIHIRRDFGIASELADVRVQTCTAHVVVASGQVRITLELVGALFAARYQQHLGMGLEAHHAIHHLHAQRLQLLGPIDIGFFVKACLELQHCQHFLAPPYRFGQQPHDFRVGARAINRLLDGQNLGVIHRFAQQLQHRIKALEGLMNDDVVLAHLRHDGAPWRELRRPCGLPLGKQQSRVIHQINQLHLAHQIHRPFDPEKRFWRQAILLQQQVRQHGRARGGNLQSHGLTVMAMVEPLAQRHAQVDQIIFVNRQIGIARHAKLRELSHFTLWKQLCQMGSHHAGNADKQALLAGDFLWQSNQPRQRTWDFDNCHFVGAAKRIHAIEANDEIQCLVGNLRKWMRGIQPHGHQQRLNLAQKELTHPFTLSGIALTVRNQPDRMLGECRNDGVVVELILMSHQRVGRGHQRLVAAAGVDAFFIPRNRCRDMGGAANLKPFIQVGRDNAEITQALQQRNILALCPAQHPFVERKNAVVAVQQLQLGCWWRRRNSFSHRGFGRSPAPWCSFGNWRFAAGRLHGLRQLWV